MQQPVTGLEGVRELRRYYPALDGMRGLAALSLVFYHAFIAGRLILCPRGDFVVDFFFVLSGFVMEQAYGRRKVSVQRFSTQRVIRLYPMLVGATLLALLCNLGSRDLLRLTAQQMFLIPSFDTAEIFPLNGPTWSLFTEALMNAAFILGVRRWSNTALVALSGLSLVFLVVVAAPGHNLSVGWEPATFLGAPLRIAFSFPIGMLLSRLAVADRLPHPPLELMAALLIGLVSVPHLARNDFVIELALAVFAAPAMVAFGAAARVKRYAVGVCSATGILSYPLYLVHMPLLQWLMANFGDAISVRFTVVVISLAVGCIATWVFDVPLRTMLAASMRRSGSLVHAR